MNVIVTLLALIFGCGLWCVGLLLWRDTEQASTWNRSSIGTLVGCCAAYGSGLFLFWWSAFRIADLIGG